MQYDKKRLGKGEIINNIPLISLNDRIELIDINMFMFLEVSLCMNLIIQTNF